MKLMRHIVCLLAAFLCMAVSSTEAFPVASPGIFLDRRETTSASLYASSPAWIWEETLRRGAGKRFPASRPVSWPPDVSLAWVPEVDAAGVHLGWNLICGSDGENLLVDPVITHGPQPYQFYGWQFQPVVDGSLGLQREWRLTGGILKVLVIDYVLNGLALVQLRVRCEWLPASDVPAIPGVERK